MPLLYMILGEKYMNIYIQFYFILTLYTYLFSLFIQKITVIKFTQPKHLILALIKPIYLISLFLKFIYLFLVYLSLIT